MIVPLEQPHKSDADPHEGPDTHGADTPKTPKTPDDFHGRRVYGHDELRELIRLRTGREHPSPRVRVLKDTSDFFRVEWGDVLMLGGRPYLVRNNEKEGRFGIDDEPKFWVRRAIDLETGGVKIVKMVYHERYTANVAGIVFECFRSPRKEARILELVGGRDDFMQGFSVKDEAGNVVRIIDYIRGKTLADFVPELGASHEDYYYNHLGRMMDDFIGMTRAVKYLHDNGEKHGDIRRDHVILPHPPPPFLLTPSPSGEGAGGEAAGAWRWIDFDFGFSHGANTYCYDLFGLGNVLLYVAGRGDVTLQNLKAARCPALDSLTADDFNIIFNNRAANLKKIHPYIPEQLNYVLMHFSIGAGMYYDNIDRFLEDLMEARSVIP